MRKRQRKKNYKARMKKTRENLAEFARVFCGLPMPSWLEEVMADFLSSPQANQMREDGLRAAEFFGGRPARYYGVPITETMRQITKIVEEPHEKADDLNGSCLGPGPGWLRR